METVLDSKPKKVFDPRLTLLDCCSYLVRARFIWKSLHICTQIDFIRPEKGQTTGMQVLHRSKTKPASLKYIWNNTVTNSLCKSLHLSLHLLILSVFVLAFEAINLSGKRCVLLLYVCITHLKEVLYFNGDRGCGHLPMLHFSICHFLPSE